LSVILHTINASPPTQAFSDCLKVVAPGDTILLLGDAVYAAMDSSSAGAALAACGVAVKVLQADAAAAGVLDDSRFEFVDMAGFVGLTEVHSRQMAWY
jgi:sulfur relay protein TusB/DsrH